MQNLSISPDLSTSTLESILSPLSQASHVFLSISLRRKYRVLTMTPSDSSPGGFLPALLICFLFLKGTHSCAPALGVCTSQNALCLDTHLLAPSLQVSP